MLTACIFIFLFKYENDGRDLKSEVFRLDKVQLKRHSLVQRTIILALTHSDSHITISKAS